jgi:peroxiredoxin
MKRKILIGLGVLVVAVLVARVVTLPATKYSAGDTVPTLKLVDIHGATVDIPSTKTKWTHLQFRRFAGCPICNLHMRSIVKRHPEIVAAGIREVVIFHSPRESLLPYQGNFPFSVIGDPEKKLYTQFGVDTSVFAILDVRAWPAIVRGNMVEDRPKGDPEGGPLGLPADFLIDTEGKIVASHYGAHAYDQWSVDELLALVK